MIMTKCNKISDEELAAYLEDMLTGKDITKMNQEMDLDTFEVLNVSRQALDYFPSDKIIDLPSWDNFDASSAAIEPLYKPLAMAGFLGVINTDDEEEEDCSIQK